MAFVSSCYLTILVNLLFIVEAKTIGGNSLYLMTSAKPACNVYYAKETKVSTRAICMLLCNRHRGCAGTAVEDIRDKWNCYFLGAGESDIADFSTSPPTQHWVKGKKHFPTVLSCRSHIYAYMQ